MARSQTSDFLHSFRYQVVASPGAPAGEVFDPQAGFATCTSPELTIETVEYREGTHTFKRKYPGLPSTNTITLTRGVAKGDTKFFDWVLKAVQSEEYRTDVEIHHFHRSDFGDVEAANRGTPSRIYGLKEALPARVKFAGDLDGSASEISIQELDIDFETPSLQ